MWVHHTASAKSQDTRPVSETWGEAAGRPWKGSRSHARPRRRAFSCRAEALGCWRPGAAGTVPTGQPGAAKARCRGRGRGLRDGCRHKRAPPKAPGRSPQSPTCSQLALSSRPLLRVLTQLRGTHWIRVLSSSLTSSPLNSLHLQRPHFRTHHVLRFQAGADLGGTLFTPMWMGRARIHTEVIGLLGYAATRLPPGSLLT